MANRYWEIAIGNGLAADRLAERMSQTGWQQFTRRMIIPVIRSTENYRFRRKAVQRVNADKSDVTLINPRVHFRSLTGRRFV